MIENGGNQTQAALAAGYSPGSAAEKAGHRLSQDVRAQELLARRRAEVKAQAEQNTGLSVERTLKELARLSYFDPRRLFDAEGNLKPIHTLDDDTAAGIAGLDVTEEYAGHGEGRTLVGYTKKVKIADKNSAIDKAMKHLGLYEKDNEQQPPAVAIGQLTVGMDFKAVRNRART